MKSSQTKSLGLFETDTAFYRDEPFREYCPQFGIETEDQKTIWLTDRGRRIALVDQGDYQIDLFEFQPGQPRLPNPQRPALYHAPTLLGARVPLAQRIGSEHRSSQTWKLSFEEQPDRLALRIAESWPGRHSVKRLELCVHPRFGYVLHIADSIQSAEPVAVETWNLLAAGLAHHHPAKRRFPFQVWHAPSRGLLKWTSNMVSLRCPGQTDREAARNLGANGWLGCLGEPDWNPLFALGEASQPCRLATCDCLLDEHFYFEPASSLTCAGTLLALPGALANRLIKRASFNELSADPFNRRLRPFGLNQFCDFETPVALDAYYRGQYWAVAENGDAWATVSDEQAHSGRWALRLRVRPEDGEKSIGPSGSSLWLDAGRSYRLTAFLCYHGRSPAACRLRASQCYFSWTENRAATEARLDADGTIGWQRLELSFRVLPRDPAAVITLAVSGDGKWFVDDLLLEELT